MAVIGNSGRKSVLGDDASLYQEEEHKNEKQKWSEMGWKQRFRYFADYYLLKTAILVFVAGISIALIWNFFRPQKETVLSVAVVDNFLVPEELERMQEEMASRYVTDEDSQQVRLDDSYGSGYEAETKLQAYITTGGIDLIITNEDHFREMAELGMFVDLNESMPELTEDFPDSVCRAVLREDDDTSSLDSESGIREPETVTADGTEKIAGAYGMRITECSGFRDAWYSDSEAVIGIVVNSEQKDNAMDYIKTMFRQ